MDYNNALTPEQDLIRSMYGLRTHATSAMQGGISEADAFKPEVLHANAPA